MSQADHDHGTKAIVAGAAILGLLGAAGCAILAKWHHLPGVLGEWVGTMVGVMTSPFFLEASLALVGLTVVLALNGWRRQRDGDDWVDLESREAPALPKDALPLSNELRFTRSGQAVTFWMLTAVFAAAAVTMAATAIYRDINPQLPHPAWVLVPIALALASARLAVHLTRHAYLILTPIGIEILPFFRPGAALRLVVWQEVASAEVDASTTVLTLHHDAAKTTGIHLSLKPIRADRRSLLAMAVIGRVGDAGKS